MFKIIITVVFVGLIIDNVKTVSVEDLKHQYVNYIMECSQKFPISQEELAMVKEKKMPQSKSVKCMFACTYEKAGILDNAGFLSVDKVYAISEKYLSDDAGKLEKAKKFADACRSVNFVDLTGHADSECERAALIFQCSIDKASQFDFVV